MARRFQGARQGRRLAARTRPDGACGSAPSGLLRALAGSLVLGLAGVLVLSLGGPAAAQVALSPVPDYIPAWMLTDAPDAAAVVAGSSAGEATAVTAVGGVAVAAAAAPLAVAAGGFVIGYAIGTAGRAAVSYAWHWGAGHDPAYADPPPVSTDRTTFLHSAVEWRCLPSGAFACYPGGNTAYGALGPAGGGSASSAATIHYVIYKAGAVVEEGDAAGNPTGEAGSADAPRVWLLGPSVVAGGIDGMLVSSSSTVLAVWGNVPGQPAPPAGGTVTAAGTTPITTTPTSGCSDGSTQVGPAVHYTGATASADLPPITAPACPAGTQRTSFSTPSTTAAGPTTSPLPTWTAPTVPSGFPQCQPLGRCQLVLLRHSPAGRTLNCADSGVCAGWQTQAEPKAPDRTVERVPDGATVTEPTTTWPNGDTAQCLWGPYDVDVAECGTVATDPAPSPTPAADPATGPAGSPPAGDGDCTPSGWGMLFNPLGWIYKPVKCAIRWAFVPSQASYGTLNTMAADFQGRVPVSWIVDVGTWVPTVLGGPPTGTDPASACFVYDVHLGVLGDFHIINSCADEPVPNAIRSMRPLLVVCVYLSFLAPLAWWAWKAYAPLARGMA